MKPTADEPRLRSFIAIGLADPARTAVVKYLERLRGKAGGPAGDPHTVRAPPTSVEVADADSN